MGLGVLRRGGGGATGIAGAGVGLGVRCCARALGCSGTRGLRGGGEGATTTAAAAAVVGACTGAGIRAGAGIGLHAANTSSTLAGKFGLAALGLATLAKPVLSTLGSAGIMGATLHDANRSSISLKRAD